MYNLVNFNVHVFYMFLLRITGFLDFVHLPTCQKLENITFRKLDPIPSSNEEGGDLLWWVP
jgi:hypothetical protein